MKFLRQIIANFRARVHKFFVTQEIVKTLKIAHAVELSKLPADQWLPLKTEHAAQIAAVRAGKLDIVDRRSWAFPFLPSTLTRLQQPIIKMIPYNLRRFARTPVPRRAINMIKNSITQLDWDITPIANAMQVVDEDIETRRQVAKKCFTNPNNEQSWQTFLDTGIDDFCIMGAMIIEPQLTPNPERPIKMWNVDAQTIRFFPNWRESDPSQPHYAQMTGLKGERGIIVFYDDELIYIKDNPSVETPFGTSKMEIAFQSIMSFLGVQEMSGRAGSDQVHRTWLWWEQAATQQNLDVLARHLTNDLEGQARINLMSGMKEPQVISVQAVAEEDLLLNWQELLIRMIALSFDMSAQSFLERDVNRSTGEVLSDMDFRSSVIPTAVRIAEHLTRYILHRKLGWTDLEFKFLNLDDPDLSTKVDVLSKQYSMNAITPDEVREKLGMAKLQTPFAKLTQFEAILLQAITTSQLADKNAANASNRQMDMQQRQMEMYQQQQPSESEGESEDSGSQDKQPYNNEDDQQASAAVTLVSPKIKLLKAPTNAKFKTPKLSKLPMAGSTYNCYEVAAMSLPQLQLAMQMGQVPSDAKTLKKNMQNQDSNALLDLIPEVQEYLDMLEQLQKKQDTKGELKITPEAIADQKKKYRQGQHKPADIEMAVYRPTLRPARKSKETQGIAPAYMDQRKTGIQPGMGRGKEISTTDINKSKIRKRRTGNVGR